MVNKWIFYFSRIEFTSLRRDSIWLRESIVKQDSYFSLINSNITEQLSGWKSSWVNKVFNRVR